MLSAIFLVASSTLPFLLQYIQPVSQICDSPNLRSSNQGLLPRRLRASAKPNGHQDQCSPFAETHDGYTQSMCSICFLTTKLQSSEIQRVYSPLSRYKVSYPPYHLRLPSTPRRYWLLHPSTWTPKIQVRLSLQRPLSYTESQPPTQREQKQHYCDQMKFLQTANEKEQERLKPFLMTISNQELGRYCEPA